MLQEQEGINSKATQGETLKLRNLNLNPNLNLNLHLHWELLAAGAHLIQPPSVSTWKGEHAR